MIKYLSIYENKRKENSETDRIDRINCFSTFISFSFHPMSVEICEETVNVVGACCVTQPFHSIIALQLLVLKRLCHL